MDGRVDKVIYAINANIRELDSKLDNEFYLLVDETHGQKKQKSEATKGQPIDRQTQNQLLIAYEEIDNLKLLLSKAEQKDASTG